GVVAAAVGCEQVLAIGNETQRLRGADDLAGTRLRLDAVDVDVVESALAEHLRERRHWALLELRAKFGGQARRGRFDTRGFSRSPCVDPLPVIHRGQRAD